MPFRADEAAEQLMERTRRRLIPRSFTQDMREAAEQVLRDVVERCGPPVEAYPTWHPLIAQHDPRHPEKEPSARCGYVGLDHVRLFAHGFVACPYGDGQDVVASVEALPSSPVAYLTAEILEVPLYGEGTTPVLVRCEWTRPLEDGHTVPKSLAVPLMLERELPAWHWAERAETWETMRPYLLGEPHGSRSSLFVTQDTALAMKRIYVAMTESGMFGPS